MTGFTGNDGSGLVGGLNPSGVVKALSVDASGNLNVNASVSSGPTNITQVSSTNVGATNGLPVSGNNGGSLVVIGVDSSGRLILVPNTAFNLAQIGGQNTLVETLGAMAGAMITEDVIRNFTLAGKAFSATTTKNLAPGAVTLGFQLFNPANSGKTLLIYSLLILSAAAGIHDIRMTTADVSSIAGWSGNNVAVTPVNNKGGGAASVATCGYSNTSITGGLLGSSRETTACTANSPVETLTNGECILLPSSASINGLAVYFNATGSNNWAITAEYLEF